MTFEIELAGRARTVTVERLERPGRLRVTIDGQPCEVDAVRIGEYGLSILARLPPPAAAARDARDPGTVPLSDPERPQKGTVAVPGEIPRQPGSAPVSAEIQLTPGTAPGQMLGTFAGRTAVLTVNGRRSAGGVDEGAHGHGEARIVAPMPGRVVRVLVAPGDEVAARQGIVVVEAMKMENELRAPRPGRVKDVNVAPGAPVEAGRILAVIE
jgi:biotin carboxyl carrier protein